MESNQYLFLPSSRSRSYPRTRVIIRPGNGYRVLEYLYNSEKIGKLQFEKNCWQNKFFVNSGMKFIQKLQKWLVSLNFGTRFVKIDLIYQTQNIEDLGMECR